MLSSIFIGHIIQQSEDDAAILKGRFQNADLFQRKLIRAVIFSNAGKAYCERTGLSVFFFVTFPHPESGIDDHSDYHIKK